MIPASREDAAALDATDPLQAYHDHFDLPEGVVYLDGNSLGPPPRASLNKLRDTAEREWKDQLIASWNDAGWIDLPKKCGAKIASLIGAAPDDVLVCDSVSVNIFKLVSALYLARKAVSEPCAIAYETDEFPTDGYILQGLAKLTGTSLKKIASNGPDAAFADGIKIVVKSVVHYKSAAITDIAAWERAAEKNDAVIVWDLSHATGVIALNMQRVGARYGVGCGYKYLNGGPGAPAFIYVAKKAAEELDQPLSGWMGHAAPFDFADGYLPAPGVKRFACGTPPILSLSALDGALDVFDGIDMHAVEEKAKKLGDLFLARAMALDLTSASPGLDKQRGGHVSLRFGHSYEVVQALIAKGVIGDFRQPDIMRFGFSPLFLTYTQVWDAVDILGNILATEEWRKPEFAIRRTVT